jgi:hypothetical protein
MKKLKTKNKFFKKLEDIGFEKIPSDDGFVMYELTPSKNKGENNDNKKKS